MANRPRYTDEFRASAVLMVQAAGYPDKDGAMTRVSNKLGIPRTTLRRWFKKQQNPPPTDIVQKKEIDFKEAIEDELAAILEEFSEARQDAAYNQLATAFGILFDKRQLLTGGATENVNQHIKVINERRD